MTRSTQLWVSTPERPNHNACLVQIYPTGTGMGSCYILGDTPLNIGREPDSDIRINDTSVSRRHARVMPDTEGYAIQDQQSTNGTFVNDVRVSVQKLRAGDYLHVGTAIFRYLAGGTVEAAYHEEIYRLTIIDGLTGVHNKRYFLEAIERELVRATQHSRPLTLAMLDIDHFKAINDDLGHLAGDFALRELATCIKQTIGKEDLLARYGGEEFAVVMPETEKDKAVAAAERIRQHVEESNFSFETHEFRMTLSIGLVSTAGDESMTVTELIRLADEKLYEAKHSGRNKVVS